MKKAHLCFFIELCVFCIFSFDNKIEKLKLQNITFINFVFEQKKKTCKICLQKKKILTSEEGLKDIQKFSDEEDN